MTVWPPAGKHSPALPAGGLPSSLQQQSIANGERLRDAQTHAPRDNNGRIGSVMAESGSDAGLIELVSGDRQRLS